MSLPAPTAPIAALVLAWDETVPAVRALMEATEANTPALGSVVVVVPAGPETAAQALEESRPPAARLAAPAATSPGPAPGPAAAESLLPTTAAATPAQPAPNPATTGAALPPSPAADIAASPTSPLPASGSLTAPLATAEATTSSGVATVPGWQAVRVLRLSGYSLPGLAAHAQQALPGPTWVGAPAAPTAPYLGSAEPAPALPLLGSPAAAGLADYDDATPELVELPALASPLALGDEVSTPLAASATQPLTLPAAALALTVVSSEEGAVASPLATQLPAEAGTAALPLPAAFVPASAGWPEALSSLQLPAAAASATPVLATSTTPSSSATLAEPASSAALPTPQGHPALRPPASRFDAPNLNFQIIQYARFAVPLALAEQPFEVIYAPAWPTWLAAQELRQRTGRPLVLHVATLAAAAEPLELAAGWPAELQRQALHRADLLLAETPALAERLRHELSLPAHLVRCVPAANAAAVAQALRTAQPK